LGFGFAALDAGGVVAGVWPAGVVVCAAADVVGAIIAGGVVGSVFTGAADIVGADDEQPAVMHNSDAQQVERKCPRKRIPVLIGLVPR
jgi:hypothetical protein